MQTEQACERAPGLRMLLVTGKTPDAITLAVDFLVIGDEGSPLLGAGKKSTKQLAAEKLISEGHNIAIIREKDFLKMIEPDSE